jgi:hypothetical protein
VECKAHADLHVRYEALDQTARNLGAGDLNEELARAHAHALRWQEELSQELHELREMAQEYAT